MANETLGASFGIDITNLRAGINQANRLIRESNSEFQAAAAGMDDWSDSEEGLTAKLKNLNSVAELQNKKVDALKQEYNRLVASGVDPASASMIKLRTDINKEEAALAKTKKEIEKQTQALNDLGNETEETGDKTDEMSGKFEGLKKAGGVAVGAVTAIAGACVAAVGAFLGLAEATREYREDMAKLQTGFLSAGHSAEAATETYRGFFSVLGEEDRSIEAANHLAQLTNNEQELAQWTDICAGVVGTFGDSLPIEGLTEAANETAKVGAVTGPLADALVWAGISEDAFNEKLAACNSEQERATLITETLNGTYADAAEKYKELNGDVMNAQLAQSGLTDATAKLGAIAEPIMTTLKTLATELLVAITPFVELIGTGLTLALEGADGAAESLAEGIGGVLNTVVGKVTEILPTVLELVVNLIPSIVSTILGAIPTLVSTVLSIVNQIIGMLSTLLPTILPLVVKVALDIIDSLLEAAPQLLAAAITLLMSIVDAIPSIVALLRDRLPEIINTLLYGLLEALPDLLNAAVTLLMSIVEAVPFIVTELLSALPHIIDTVLNVVLEALPLLLNAAVTLLMSIVEAIPLILPVLVNELPSIIFSVLGILTDSIPLILRTAVSLFMSIVKAIPQIVTSLVKQMPTIIKSIVTGLKNGIKSVTTVGKDIIKGLWQGISDMAGWIAKKIKGFGESVLGGIKDFFGIASPSKIMADQVGKNLALGIGEGFEDNIRGVNAEIEHSLNVPNVNVKSGASGASGGDGGVTVYQTNHYSQAHSRYELYQTKQNTAAAMRLIVAGAT